MTERPWPWWKALFIIALLTAMAVIGFAFLVAAFAPPRVPRRPFDSQQWKSNKDMGAYTVRQQMADSLLAHGRLVGKSRSEVLALLGPPDGIDQKGPSDKQVSRSQLASAHQYDYELGPSDYLDYEYLSVQFDSRGRSSYGFRWVWGD